VNLYQLLKQNKTKKMATNKQTKTNKQTIKNTKKKKKQKNQPNKQTKNKYVQTQDVNSWIT
jgi:hypothetical protein